MCHVNTGGKFEVRGEQGRYYIYIWVWQSQVKKPHLREEGDGPGVKRIMSPK